MTPRLLETRLATVYRTGSAASGLVFECGKPAPGLDEMLDRHGHETAIVITACDPNRTPLPRGRNNAAQGRLRAVLKQRGFSLVETVATERGEGDQTNDKPAILAFGAGIDDLLELTHEFGQDASILITRGKVPELVLLPLAGPVRGSRR